jgi:tripartite-type tricarboxylate transporter receptor subunit TctC
VVLTKKSVLALLAAGSLVLSGCVESAEDQADPPAASGEDNGEPTFDDDGVLQPLPDGFPEGPITIVNTDDAGSRDGLYARTLDQALADISPVDIIVSDEPRAVGGTVDTLVEFRDREGGMEGYLTVVSSVLGTSTDFHSVNYEEELDISLEDLDFFIATEEYPYVLAQRADAPWGDDFASFVDHARANPGDLRYISGGVGSGVDLTMEWLISELDIEVTKVPAADREAAIAAVGGGAGDFTLTQPELAMAAEEQGRATVIFASTEEAPDEWEGRVATAADYPEYGVSEATWGTVQGLLLPAEVDDSHVAWLSALFEAAFETDEYQKRAETQAGVTLRLWSGEDANALAKTLYDFSEPVVRDAGLHWEDAG